MFGHLWVEDLTYIQIFAFKFTLRCLQHDIASGVVDTGGNLLPASTTQAELVAKFAASLVDTGGKFPAGVNYTSVTGVIDNGDKFAPKLALREFSKKFLMTLSYFQVFWGR